MVDSVLLKARALHKSYAQGVGSLSILKGVDLEIRSGEALCILGSSGAGKSTLLQILGTLDKPDSGELIFDGMNLLDLDDEAIAKFRSQKMGFVFQFHHLLSELTALENILLPSRIASEDMFQARRHAHELLDQMGLSSRASHYPSELSGGELQRVAIARALSRRPQILFADEPTGNLDSENSKNIQDLFFELRRSMGLTFVVVTHDLQFASRFPRVLRMRDGRWSQE